MFVLAGTLGGIRAGTIPDAPKPTEQHSEDKSNLEDQEEETESGPSRVRETIEALPDELPMLRGEIRKAVPTLRTESVPTHEIETDINPFLSPDHAKAYVVHLMNEVKRECIDTPLTQTPDKWLDGLIGLTVSPGTSPDVNSINLRFDEFGDAPIEDVASELPSFEQDHTFEETLQAEDVKSEHDDGNELTGVEIDVSDKPIESEEQAGTDEPTLVEDQPMQKSWHEFMEAKFFPDTETMELSPAASMQNLLPTIIVSGSGSEIESVFRDYYAAIELAHAYLETGMTRKEIKTIMDKKFEKQKKKQP